MRLSPVRHDESRWYVIHTRPKQEDRADENLRAWGIETFSPKLKRRRVHTSGRLVDVIVPLFPRYLFARFPAAEMLHRVRFTRGIHDVVTFDGRATPVDEALLDIVRARIGPDGFARIGDDARIGDAVLIEDGPMKSFVGIFEREMKDRDRVLVLLTTVNCRARVVVAKAQIRKLDRKSVA